MCISNLHQILAKGANEPSTGDTGFYFKGIVGSKPTGGFIPYLILINYMYIPISKKPTVMQVW